MIFPVLIRNITLFRNEQNTNDKLLLWLFRVLYTWRSFSVYGG